MFISYLPKVVGRESGWVYHRDTWKYTPTESEITMWENQENNNEEPTVEQVAKATYEELEARLVEANGNINRFKYNNEAYASKLSARNDQVDKLEEYLKENWESLDEHAEEIAEIFDISITSTKTFTFTLEVEVEVTANSPAYNWSDFDGSELDFDVSASVAYNSRNDLDDATVESTDVRECEEA
jgi:predicted nuclease with TOPRIM domain